MRSYNFKVHLLYCLLVTVFICAIAFIAQAETISTEIFQADKKWFYSNWPAIGLVLSEIIAFVPTKAQGLAHALFIGLKSLAKKKRL